MVAEPKPILVIENEEAHEKLEIFLLNPGETFPRFGGARNGLTVRGKTASLITRRTSPMCVLQEHEWDLTEPKVWRVVQDLIDEVKNLRSFYNAEMSKLG